MGVTLGVDVGGSTTKVAGCRDGEIFAVQQVWAGDQLTSAYGAVGRFIHEQKLEFGKIDHVYLTGVGESRVNGDMYGIPTARRDEFTSIARGGLMLAGLERALVVSMGTGTAFVRADGDTITHLGGSGVGGGTIMGLCGRFFNVHHFDTIVEIAKRGDLSRVDLKISDILSANISTLTNDMTAANFGKLSDNATQEDIVLGVINMVLQTIGVMAVFACKNDTIKTVVLTGALAQLPQAAEMFQVMERVFGIHFIIPDRAVYATAAGAALSWSD